MTEVLSTSARRVQDALHNAGFPCQVVELPQSTRTSVEAARAIGCQVGQIVKSIVFRARRTGQAVLAIASGANRVNEKVLAQALGEPVEKADADFVREATGFVIGGVPPLGHAHPLVVFVDPDLLQYEEIWAAAGTPHAVFKLTPGDLVTMSGGRVVSFA